MAGPGGKEVGRVSVRVVPNTERFRRKLKRDLEKQTRGLKVKIPVEIDQKGFKKLRKDINDLNREKIRIKVDVDSKKVSKGLAQIDKEAGRERKFNFDFDEESLRRLREYAMRQKIRILADVEINKNRLQRDLNSTVFRARAQMDVDDHRLRNRITEMEERQRIRVQTQLDLDAIRERNRVQREMDRQQRVKIKADLDSNYLQKSLSKLGDLLNPSKGAFALFNGGGDFTMLAKFLAVLFLASPLISTVASLLAGLPSLLFAVGAAAGAVYLGWDGIKAAAQQLTPVLDNLKASLSEVFEQRLTGQFEKLGTAMASWEPGLKAVANGFLDMTDRMITFVSTGAGLKMINGILENTGELFTLMAPGMETLTNAFLKLGAQGASSFGHLATAFNTISNGFNDVVERLSESGAMDRAMKGLSDTVIGLGNAFNSLFESGVESMGKMGPAMGRFFTSFGEHIGAMMPHLTSLSIALLDVASSVMDVLTPVLEKTAPAFTRLVEGGASFVAMVIDQFGPALEEMATVLSDGLMTVLDELAPMLPELTKYFAELGRIMLEAVKDNGPLMADAFARIAESFAKMAPELAEMLPDLLKLAEEVIPLIVQSAPNMVSIFASIAESIALLSPHFDDITRIMLLFGRVLIIVLQGLSNFIAIASQIPNPLSIAKTAISTLGDTVRTVGTKFTEFKNTISRTVEEVKSTIQTFVDGTMNTLTTWVTGGVQKAEELKNGILTTLRNLPGEMLSLGAQMVQGLINGIRNMIGTAVAEARSLAGQVKDAFKGAMGINSPSTVFRDFGVFMVAGLKEGLKKTDPAEKATMSLADHVKRAFEQSAIADLPRTIGMGAFSSVAGDLGFSSSGAVGSLIDAFASGSVTPNEKESGPTYIVKDLDEAHRKEDTRKKKASLQFRKR